MNGLCTWKLELNKVKHETMWKCCMARKEGKKDWWFLYYKKIIYGSVYGQIILLLDGTLNEWLRDINKSCLIWNEN